VNAQGRRQLPLGILEEGRRERKRREKGEERGRKNHLVIIIVYTDIVLQLV
jgi:hypothetical protein